MSFPFRGFAAPDSKTCFTSCPLLASEIHSGRAAGNESKVFTHLFLEGCSGRNSVESCF